MKKNIISKIIEFFKSQFKNWDIIDLDRIPEEDSSFDNMRSALVITGLKHKAYFSTANWYLDKINYPSSSYFESHSKRFRKQISYQIRRMKKSGEVKIEIKSEFDSLDDDLDIYEKIRGKSWKAPEKDRVFNREIVKLSAKKGWLRYGVLYCGDVPIAAQKWIICGNVAYILSLSYDDNYRKYSPGSILSLEMFKHAIDHEKVNKIDYLTGDESYKRIWTPLRSERKGITIFNKNLKGQFLAFLMLFLLPIFEKNQFLISAKTKIYQYLKKH